MIPPFQAKFLDCMSLLYPSGGLGKSQVVDLVRTFFMGWTEALLAAGCVEQASQILDEFSFLNDPAWEPGADWCWW